MIDVESILRQAIINGIDDFRNDADLFNFTFADYALAEIPITELQTMLNDTRLNADNVRFEFGEDSPNQTMIVLQLNEHKTSKELLGHTMYDTLASGKTRSVVGRISEISVDVVVLTPNSDMTRFVYYLLNAIFLRKNVYFESKGILSIDLKLGTDLQRYAPSMPHNSYMRVLQVEAMIEEKTYLEVTKPYDDVEVHHYKEGGRVTPILKTT